MLPKRKSLWRILIRRRLRWMIYSLTILSEISGISVISWGSFPTLFEQNIPDLCLFISPLFLLDFYTVFTKNIDLFRLLHLRMCLVKLYWSLAEVAALEHTWPGISESSTRKWSFGISMAKVNSTKQIADKLITYHKSDSIGFNVHNRLCCAWSTSAARWTAW